MTGLDGVCSQVILPFHVRITCIPPFVPCLLSSPCPLVSLAQRGAWGGNQPTNSRPAQDAALVTRWRPSRWHTSQRTLALALNGESRSWRRCRLRTSSFSQRTTSCGHAWRLSSLCRRRTSSCSRRTRICGSVWRLSRLCRRVRRPCSRVRRPCGRRRRPRGLQPSCRSSRLRQRFAGHAHPLPEHAHLRVRKPRRRNS